MFIFFIFYFRRFSIFCYFYSYLSECWSWEKKMIVLFFGHQWCDYKLYCDYVLHYYYFTSLWTFVNDENVDDCLFINFFMFQYIVCCKLLSNDIMRLYPTYGTVLRVQYPAHVICADNHSRTLFSHVLYNLLFCACINYLTTTPIAAKFDFIHLLVYNTCLH